MQRADVRIIAATHRDLAAMIRKGLFREDLFYRLNVVKLDLPPLRKRKEDIPLLVEHFITRFNRRQGKNITGIAQEVMALLMAHDYPGNVRELENIIERAFVLCGSGMIERTHLPPELTGILSKEKPFIGETFTARIHAAEAQSIQETLEKHGFNRSVAARTLGLHKSTLFRKIKALGITLPDKDGRSKKK